MTTADLDSDSAPTLEPFSIGPYTVLERLGVGGMGEVFLAEQHEPVRRRVALKLIKLGMDSREVIARFELERQAIALMDHDGIARIYDCGTSDRGQPYFVMELVKGIAVTDFARRGRLSLAQRLELVRQICAAVQHAHQKGVVHRDLKPANILVSDEGGKMQIKIIDFGLAKAMGQALAKGTLFTEIGQIMGTPEYMAPEQADPTNLDVDTRADIYSLGVILHELLVDELPFSRQELRKGGFVELQRILREVEPPKPSSRLDSSADHGSSVAAMQRRSVQSLRRAMRGDLDWVVLKALDKDRNRRYETANALSAELQRFLDHEPLVAGPPSGLYRLKKLLRRHRGQVAAAALVFGALVAGSITTWLQYRRAEDNLRDAVARQAEAEFEQRRAAAINAFLLEDMLSAVMPEEMGRDVRVVEILEQARRDVGRRFADDPLVAAGVRLSLGSIYKYLAEFDDALPLLESALASFTALEGPGSESALRAQLALTETRMDRGEIDGRLAEFRAIHAAAREELGPEHATSLAAHGGVCETLASTGQLDAAANIAVELIEIRERNDGRDAISTCGALRRLASIRDLQGRNDDAERLFQDVLQRLKTHGGLHPEIIRTNTSLAEFYTKRYRNRRARELLEETVSMCETMYGPDHPVTGKALYRLGTVVKNLYDSREGLEILERALAILVPRLGADHTVTLGTVNAIGNAMMRIDGREQESIAILQENLERRIDVLGEDSPGVAESHEALAMALSLHGDPSEALEHYEACIAYFTAENGPTSETLAGPLANFGNVLVKLELYGRAVDVRERSYELDLKLMPGGERDGYVIVDRCVLGEALVLAGRPEDAEAHLRAARTNRVGVLADDNTWTRTIDRWLAESLVAQERFTEAEDLYLSVRQWSVEHDRKDPWVPKRIAAMYATWGQLDKAETFRAESAAWSADD